MSDTTTIPHVKISNPDQFRAFIVELNKTRSDAEKIKTGERGRLPMRAVAPIIVRAQLDGKLTFEDTDYFPISRWAFGETVGTRKSKDEVSYLITYTVKGTDKPQTLTLTENEVRSYLPNVKGIVGGAFATMAVALHLNAEDSSAPLTSLLNYTVSKVERVEATEEAPKGDDTGEQKTDADKASEPEHASEEAIKAAIAAGEESVKPAPVEVKAESKPRATTRTRAASAKTPAKPKTTKEKVSA